MYFQQIFLIISEVHKGPCCVFVGIGDRICYNMSDTDQFRHPQCNCQLYSSAHAAFFLLHACSAVVLALFAEIFQYQTF